MKIAKRLLRVLLIAAFWLGVWTLISWRVGKPSLLPSPIAVLHYLLGLLKTKEFYLITAASLRNVLLGIVTAVAFAALLSLLTYRIKPVRELLTPLMTVIKATPVASFIVLALIWIGSARVPFFITFLIVVPIVWTNLDEGFRRIDPKLAEVTRVYRLGLVTRWRVLILPSLRPYFLSACRTSMGLAWKAGIAAEIIAMPRNTIGTMIGEAKLYIEAEAMFAWTLTVILLSLVIEFLFSAFFKRLEKHVEPKEDTV